MPAICRRCRSKPAEVRLPYARMSLCPDCFRRYFEDRIRRTVQEFKMFKPQDTVGVAVSGGKDSAALLHGLRQAFPGLKLVALHVDLGIKKYSEHCLEKVRALTRRLEVELHVFDLKRELGFSIDDFRLTPYRRKICAPCGTIKRHLFDELARGAGVKVLATGHNLDDVVGTMLTTFLAGDWSQLVRLKPVLPPLSPLQTRKVKPLLRSPEWEDLLYAAYSDLPFRDIGCPHAGGTRVRRNQELLEALSRRNPAFRHQTLNNFLRLIPILEKHVDQPPLTTCRRCGYPSSAEVCAYCRRVELVKNTLEKRRQRSKLNPLLRGINRDQANDI